MRVASAKVFSRMLNHPSGPAMVNKVDGKLRHICGKGTLPQQDRSGFLNLPELLPRPGSDTHVQVPLP